MNIRRVKEIREALAVNSGLKGKSNRGLLGECVEAIEYLHDELHHNKRLVRMLREKRDLPILSQAVLTHKDCAFE